MSETMTLYAPPSADLDISDIELGDAEIVRKEHLGHEASLRSVGALYYLGTAFLGCLSIFSLVAAFDGSESGAGVMVVIAIVYGLFAAGYAAIGRGLRNCSPRVKTAATVFSVIGLLGFPLGTLINAYILYLLHSQKGKVVLSREYQDVVAQTPHLKHKSSIVVWIALALIVLLMGAAIVVPMFS